MRAKIVIYGWDTTVIHIILFCMVCAIIHIIPYTWGTHTHFKLEDSRHSDVEPVSDTVIDNPIKFITQSNYEAYSH